jgi:hypothetical protein
MSLSCRQFLLSAGREAVRYAWALLLARIHEVLPLPCSRGRVRPLPTLEGIQSKQVKARRFRDLSGGFIRFLWPDLSAVADGFGAIATMRLHEAAAYQEQPPVGGAQFPPSA